MAIYRSKLNFTDLSRELNRHARSDRGLTLSTQALRERRDLRLEAAIQLASDEALRAEPIATRFAQDEAFAQLAVDALNYVPRRWEANFTAELECSDAMLEAELARRSSGKADAPAPTSTPASSAPAPPDPPGKPPAHDKETERNSTVAPLTVPVPKISAPDMALIRKLVDRQLGFLTNFKTLAQALHDRPRPDPWRLDEIVPLEIGQSLIAADNLNEHRYRFLLDNSALPIAVVAAPTEPAGKQAQDLVALFDAFASVLEFSGPSIDALVAAGYLPATITSEAFANARKLLAGPDRSPELVERAARTGDLLQIGRAHV